jgi:hypothetical protein
VPTPTPTPRPLTADEVAEDLFGRLVGLYDQALKHMSESVTVMSLAADNAGAVTQPGEMADWFLLDYVMGTFDRTAAYGRMLSLYGVDGDDYETIATAMQALYAYYSEQTDTTSAYLAIEKLAYRNGYSQTEWGNINGELAELKEKYPNYERLTDLQDFCKTVGWLMIAQDSCDDLDTVKTTLDAYRKEKRSLTAAWASTFDWKASDKVSRVPQIDPVALQVLTNGLQP